MEFVVMLGPFTARHTAHAGDGMSWVSTRLLDEQRPGFSVAESVFQAQANFFVTGPCSDKPVPFQNAPCVRVHHEHRIIAGVEQNGVCRFRAYAVQVQQLLVKIFCWLWEEGVGRATSLF